MKWFQKHTSWLQKISVFQCNEFKKIENKFNFSLRKLKIFGIFGTFERHWNLVNEWHPFLRTFWLKFCQSSRKTKMNIFEKKVTVSLPYSLKRSHSYQNYYIKHILNTENMVHTQDQMFIISKMILTNQLKFIIKIFEWTKQRS